MKRHLILSGILMVLMAMSLYASEPFTLLITTKNHEETRINLKEKPKINFSGSEMVVSTQITDLSFPVDNLKDMSYVQEEMGIKSISDSRILIDDYTIYIMNNGNRNDIGIYGLDGKVISFPISQEVEGYKIDISKFVPGIYIVKVNNTTFKIMKK